MNKFSFFRELLFPLSLISLTMAYFGSVHGTFQTDRFFVLALYFLTILLVRYFVFGPEGFRVEAFKENLSLSKSKFLFAGTLVDAYKKGEQSKSPSYLSVKAGQFFVVIAGVALGFIYIQYLDSSSWREDLSLLFLGQLLFFAISPVHLRFCLVFSACYQIMYAFRYVEPDPIFVFPMVFLLVAALAVVTSLSRLGMVGRKNFSYFDLSLYSLTYVFLAALIFNGVYGILPREEGDKTLFETIGVEKLLKENWSRVGPGLIKVATSETMSKVLDVDGTIELLKEQYEERKNTPEFRKLAEEMKRWSNTIEPMPKSLIKDRLELVGPVRDMADENPIDSGSVKRMLEDVRQDNKVQTGQLGKDFERHKNVLYSMSRRESSELIQKMKDQVDSGEMSDLIKVMDIFDSTNLAEKYEDDWVRNRIRESVTSKNTITKFLENKKEELLPEEIKEQFKSESDFEIKALIDEFSKLFSKIWGYAVVIVFLFVGYRVYRNIGKVQRSTRKLTKARKRLTEDELKGQFLIFRNKFDGSPRWMVLTYDLFVDMMNFKRLKKPEHLPPTDFVELISSMYPEISDEAQFISDKFCDVSFGYQRLDSTDKDQVKVNMLRIYSFVTRASSGTGETTKVQPIQTV